jgi:hypothetical protein
MSDKLVNRICIKLIINLVFPPADTITNYPNCILRLLTEHNNTFYIDLYSNIYCKFKNQNINYKIQAGTLINKLSYYVSQAQVTLTNDYSDEYQFIHDIIH